MRDIDVVAELVVKLKQCYLAEKWPHFIETDNQLRAQLMRIKSAHLNSDDQLTLSKLKTAYITLYHHCHSKLKLVEDKMIRHRRHQEGAVAYAKYNNIFWGE